jgi:hypothetical protein
MTPAVVAAITIKLFFNNPQKDGVLRIPMRLSQCAGYGNEYGCEYISPVVFKLPKTRITRGTSIEMRIVERTMYWITLDRCFRT